MNNLNNSVDIEKIYSQLERADVQKNRLILNIYREYEFYLNILRDILYSSVEKGLNELCTYLSIKNNFVNTNDFFYLFEKKISKLIYSNLPLITVEQLKINELEKKINREFDFNGLGSSAKKNNDQKEKFQYRDGSQLEEPIKFQINEDISKTYEYYRAENNENFASLDLDKNYLSNDNIENIEFKKHFISSLLELTKEVQIDNPRYLEKDNINQMFLSTKHQSLKVFDLIENSLENLLLNLSYKINQELYKFNLIKKIISQESFDYVVGKKLMIKHPNPFVINFKFNLNQSSSYGENLPNIVFFYMSTVELEFKNLNLSIQRNKINELKNHFQHLIKKEKYWKQKEITLNKIR